MKKPKRLARVIMILLFGGILAGTVFFSKHFSLRNLDDIFSPSAKTDKGTGFFQLVNNNTLGITFRHLPEQLDPKLKNIEPLISSMGASVSICDFDNDGWNDIYFTNSQTGSQNVLYRNLHNGQFADVAGEMGVADVNQAGTGSSMGSVWGDFNNDGFEDLLLYKWGRPELFENEGGKKFVRVTDGSGLPAWMNANSAIWFDFDNDGLLDIFLGGYFSEKLDLQHLQTTAIMPESFRYANNGGRNYLLKNMGNGKFKDVTEAYGLTSTKWTLAAGAADFTGDGYPELMIANDYNVDEFYINIDGKKFEEKGRQTGIGFIPKSGMNASFGDIDNTGAFGIYTTNITEKGILIQGNNFWKPRTDRLHDLKFMDLAPLAGIENAGWSYCAQFGDLNNDGYMDLYVANGFISADSGTSYWYDYSKVTVGNSNIIGNANNWPSMGGKSQSGYQQNKIWLNTGKGLFRDASDQISASHVADSRAVALADLWNRGVLDIVVANQNNIPFIYKNETTNKDHWIDFDLHGTVSNASAIGARVELSWNGMKQVQVITGGIGFSSQNQHRIHFGIGKSTHIDNAFILWPSGQMSEINHPDIDKLYSIQEPSTKK